MTTSDEDNSSSLLAAERVLLRALGHRDTPDALRTEIFQSASAHEFRDAEHGIVFRALRVIGPHDFADLQFHLAAQVTRLGFPDVELDELFAGPGPAETEIRGALDWLAAARGAKA